MAALVLQIGRYWARLPAPDIEALRNIMQQLRPAHSGMSKRTESRVRAVVEDPARLDTLLTLPVVLMEKACRAGPPSQRLAQQAQTAVVLEVLLRIPMRLRNLGGLRLGQHLRRHGRTMSLSVAAHETKNEMPIAAQLPKDTSRLIEVYIERFRPFLCSSANDWLLPGELPGKPKTGDAIRTQIRKVAASECGVILTPHDFRSLAGFLTLREDRGAHGKVQRILGHKSLATTMAHYSGLEASLAAADFGDLIDARRADAWSRTKSSPRVRSKPSARSSTSAAPPAEDVA